MLKAIWEKGNGFLDTLRSILKKYDTGAELSGIAPMFFVTFKKDENKIYRKKRIDFYAQLIRRGVFMQPYHHSYICYRHTEEDLEHAAKMINESLIECKKLM